MNWIVRLLRRGLGRTTPVPGPGPIWDGIYSHVRAVPREGPQYDNPLRLQEFVDQAKSAQALIQSGQVPYLGWHEPMTTVAAVIRVSGGKLRVLDFGGGVGLAYLCLLGTLKNAAGLAYHIVELDNACHAGRELFASDQRVKFYNALPELKNEIDLIYVSTVLQYIDDYAGLLRQLFAIKAPYVFLGQLAAGSFHTYATRQLNLTGQILPYWFINKDEILALAREQGYVLAYESQHGREYDQSNFPATHRVGRMRNLLFVKCG